MHLLRSLIPFSADAKTFSVRNRGPGRVMSSINHAGVKYEIYESRIKIPYTRGKRCDVPTRRLHFSDARGHLGFQLKNSRRFHSNRFYITERHQKDVCHSKRK